MKNFSVTMAKVFSSSSVMLSFHLPGLVLLLEVLLLLVLLSEVLLLELSLLMFFNAGSVVVSNLVP
jgi:hypothetical protein